MGVELYSTISGDGPAIIILHGLFGSTTNWRGIAKKLAATHTVYCLDLRNHGQSPWADNMSYTDLADDVVDFLNHNKLRRVAIIGHSMGGKTAMCVALNYPGLIDNLIIVDIAPITYNHSHADYVDAMRALDISAISSRTQADTQLGNSIPELPIRQFLLQNLVYSENEFKWRINLDAIAENMNSLMTFPTLQDMQVFTGQALFVYGEQSNYLRSDHYDLIRKHFPYARFNGIPRAGHWIHAEQPQMFFRNIDTFLTSSGEEQTT